MAAALINEIQWGDPLLPPVRDAAWEAEIRRRGGQTNDAERRIAANPWLREAAFDAVNYAPSEIPPRLYRMGVMVISQENSCRYCYGANRAFMKILGYPESFIQKIERDLHLAELDDKERAFLAFCRNLARSRPRPSGAARDALVAAGYTRLAVHEMAFAVGLTCFFNRVTTMIACPPEMAMERLANGPLRRVIGLVMPLMLRLGAARLRKLQKPPLTEAELSSSPFRTVLLPLAGLQAARVMRSALDGAFAPSALSRMGKALVFAVVARTLGCVHCESAAQAVLREEGLDDAEVGAALASLQSVRLPESERGLLAWARGTVHYEPATLQQQTRELAKTLGNEAVLDAVGVAALANATVRLAMLQA